MRLQAYNGRAMARPIPSRSTTAAALLAAAAFAVSVWFGVKTAGGPDPFGYLSQAWLWLDGTLIVTQPSVHLGSRFAEQLLSPLGYTPGPLPGTLVPTYPPGLALMMALGLLVFGAWGAFLVVPASAGALVLATYFLGRRLDSTETGLAAAGLLALSPAVIYSGLWPMSDVPAAALWTLWLLALVRHGGAAPVTAGALAGLAILVRPNLAPLALAGLWLVWRHGGGRAPRPIARLAIYVAVLVPFAVFLAWFNNHLYGSPLRSGYGSVDRLYDASFIAPNVANYTGWLFESQGLLFCLLAAFGWARAFTITPLRPLAVFAALTAASYLPYLVFDAWWYLRFLLPAYPVIFIMAAAGLLAMARRLRPGMPRAVFAAAVLVAAAPGVWFIARENPFLLRDGEHRFAAIGAYVRDALPPNAAFLTVHHSGSVRYYGGRLTVRYDWLPAGLLAPARAALEDAGYVTYVLIDEPEEAQLRERFTRPGELAFLAQPPIVELLSEPRVRIYALSDEVPPDWPEYVRLGRAVPAAPVNPKVVVWDPPEGR